MTVIACQWARAPHAGGERLDLSVPPPGVRTYRRPY
jgi:hypothetical protein